MRFPSVLSLTLLAACGGETGGGGAPPADEDRPLRADFEEVYRIGGIAAEGWDASRRSRSWISTRTAGCTSATKPDPRPASWLWTGSEAWRRSSGAWATARASFAKWRTWWPAPGGGVVIVDDGHRAYLLFGPDGSFERAVRFAIQGASETASAETVRSAREGNTLFLTRSPAASLSGGEMSIETGDRTIYRVSLGEADEAVAVPFAEGWEAQPEREVTMEAADPSDMFGALGEAFTGFVPDLVFDVLPGGGVAYSDSSAYAIKMQPASGAPARVAGRSLHPVPVTESLRERARERMLEGMQASAGAEVDGQSLDDLPPAFRAEMAAMIEEMVAGMRDAVANAGFMTEVPLVRDVRTTWEGTIWVQRWGNDPLAQIEFASREGGGEPREAEEAAEGWIDVLSQEGEYVGTLSLEDTSMPDAFGPGGLVAFVETDEFDVPTIILKRLPEAERLELGTAASGAPDGGR